MIRLSDLDAKTQAKILARRAARVVASPTPPTPTRRRSRTAGVDAGPLGPDRGSYTCRTCGDRFVGFTKAERHVNVVHRGGAIRLDLASRV